MDPAVVRIVEKGYSVVHRGLVDSSWTPRCMAVDRKGLSEGEEKGVETGISESILG